MIKKRCRHCGKEFEAHNEKHNLCEDCFAKAQAARGGGAAPAARKPSPPQDRYMPDTTTGFSFGPNYLKDGYFHSETGYLRAEELDSLSMEIAKLFKNCDMKPHQLRRFFNRARDIQASLSHADDFEAFKADILSLKSGVAYQVGREMAPVVFQQFIERNVELAVQSKKNFVDGFVRHFEWVLAYFVYYQREKEERWPRR